MLSGHIDYSIVKMSSAQNGFSYQPLSQSPGGEFEVQTRLIYLHPGGFHDCLYCTIYHANILAKQPQTKYTALSYVWGDSTQTHSIQLGYHQLPTSSPAHTWPCAPSSEADDYKSFPVTRNLETALRHLRDRALGCILWVDAVCINQSDWEERLSQVRCMGQVYAEAMEVRIWLGSVSDVCVSALKLQEDLGTDQLRRDMIHRGFLSPEKDTENILSSERVIGAALLAAMDYVMDEDHLLWKKMDDTYVPDSLQALGIRIIAMQPWWRRVWVIQEATLSKEDPVMQYGYMQIGYRRFLEMAKHHVFRDTLSTPCRTYTSINVQWMFYRGYEPSETSLASRLLTYLSCMSGNFEASIPKDRINGVHGLVNMGRCHDNILLLMTQNQSHPTNADFFHLIAIWILFDPEPQSHPLRILESGPSSVEGLPSWVPTWESKQWSGEGRNNGAPESEYDILAQGTSMGKIHHPGWMGICPRCTAKYKKKWGAPKSFFDINVRCTELRLYNALALGRVTTTVKVLARQGNQDIGVLRKAILEIEERILAALRSMDIPYANAKSRIRTFRDYLSLNFWDTDTTKNSCPSKHIETLEEFLQHERNPRKRKSQRRNRKVSAPQVTCKAPSSSSIAKLNGFFEQARDLVIGSTIVGHMFEDSLPTWRCGDRLYLIPECRWVLGLRSNGNGYRYMYRVFISDLEWQQRKQLFGSKGIYENILLV